MDTGYRQFLDTVDKTLQFQFVKGDISRVVLDYSTGWRTIDAMVLSHLTGYSTLIKRKGKPDLQINSHETICVCPGVHHCIEITPHQCGLCKWSHVNFWILGGIDIFTILDPASVIRGEAAERIGMFNVELVDLSRKTEPSLDDILRKKIISTSLFSIIAENSQMRPDALLLLQNTDRIALVIKHIKENLKSDLGRDELAKLANLSTSRFDVLFKSFFRISPMTYVHSLRLTEARQMLISSNSSIKEIAASVGHDDPFHFSRIFKRHYGASPQAFRRQSKESIT